jgi:hypothetical protein
VAAELERVFGQQPEASNGTGRQQVSFLISKAQKAQVTAACKTVPRFLLELFQCWTESGV